MIGDRRLALVDHLERSGAVIMRRDPGLSCRTRAVSREVARSAERLLATRREPHQAVYKESARHCSRWVAATLSVPGRFETSRMTTRPETVEILRHLHGKPGHDEVKADFRQLLVAEFDVPLSDVRFEQRIEVKSRTDALIGRTVFEAKKDLVREWADVERKMPDYLRNREQETGEAFVGIASDGRLWRVLARKDDALVKIKETILNPDKPGDFLSWLDGALALKVSLPPNPTTVRIELGADSVAFHTLEQDCRVRLQPFPQRPQGRLGRKC